MCTPLCQLFFSFIHVFFFFIDTATTEIYTLSLHDALPISDTVFRVDALAPHLARKARAGRFADRKSTRLNSSHLGISYAVFCLKKKKDGTHARANPRNRRRRHRAHSGRPPSDWSHRTGALR